MCWFVSAPATLRSRRPLITIRSLRPAAEKIDKLFLAFAEPIRRRRSKSQAAHHTPGHATSGAHAGVVLSEPRLCQCGGCWEANDPGGSAHPMGDEGCKARMHCCCIVFKGQNAQAGHTFPSFYRFKAYFFSIPGKLREKH